MDPLSNQIAQALGGSITDDGSPRWAWGNLNGVFGYVSDIYGIAAGLPGGPLFSVDAVNGLRIGYNGTTKIRLDLSGNAYFAGMIEAGSGHIGGWSIGATALTAGAGANTVGIDSGGVNPAFYAGSATPALAPFRVTQAGALTATSGEVGGFTITGTELYAGTGATRVEMQAAGGFWAGATAFVDAPFSVSPAGVLKAASGTIGGWTLSATELVGATGVAIRKGQTAYNTGTGFWLGDVAGTPKFSLGVAGGAGLTWDGAALNVNGAITSTSGTIGGFTITASELFAGTGATRVEMQAAGGFWAGATAFADAPFSVSPAGVLKAASGTIGGFTISSSTLIAGSGATTVAMDSGNGFWAGATLQGNAPFRVSVAGAMVATSGSIGGLSIGASSLAVGGGGFGSATFYVGSDGKFSLGSALKWDTSTLKFGSSGTVWIDGSFGISLAAASCSYRFSSGGVDVGGFSYNSTTNFTCSGNFTAANIATNASGSVGTGSVTTGRLQIGTGGIQVVGAQGAAVADATNATDVITQLNALLARLRTHGLIAT